MISMMKHIKYVVVDKREELVITITFNKNVLMILMVYYKIV